ncbi:hypothetical protein GH714_011260 [Hevea brasiliensis]|uniref:Uncharacterized protein n=1 Tax=Hevea brasiliensis TaxID=3981 RepID=A0A6A6N2Q6_HEVBR|nr:hypothetical protein GH714_011260 [Hevea brasiliensis]
MHTYGMAFGGEDSPSAIRWRRNWSKYWTVVSIGTIISTALIRGYGRVSVRSVCRSQENKDSTSTTVNLSDGYPLETFDIRGSAYGLLAAHPVAPLVSVHHLDYVDSLFPHKNQMDSLKSLNRAYQLDPPRILQQTFCHDKNRKWSISIAWGFTVQLYPSLLASQGPANSIADIQNMEELECWTIHIQYPTHEVQPM